MTLRERRFIRKLRERDEKAFRDMVERYRDQVYNTTYRMLGNREEAEDLAQEVFITVFKSIDSFRGESKFSTWLYRITVNHCKNRIKYLARRHDRDQREYDENVTRDGAEAALTAPARPRSPDRQLEGVEMEQILQRCIAELDDDHRILIVLRDIQDLSYEEIGTITSLPEGTVKSRLHRGRMALRKKMQKYM
ncbi:MAG: sigma-70 family RNA polymerase sigma factor [Proteobacteria bacterium]|nr:sigma-70 family RNA polymerase sigma factor [Pseudomonadota bacterium]